MLCVVDLQIYMSSPAILLETQTYMQLSSSQLHLIHSPSSET